MDTSTWRLRPHAELEGSSGPVVLVVMDGVGLGPADETNAWHAADTPFLDSLLEAPVSGRLAAHGTAVGMPSDEDMGNSEVGHNALGAGRVFDQGAKLVANAVAEGSLCDGPTWRWLVETCLSGGTLHLMGLWSDGNVHSHLDHAYALVEGARAAGVTRVRLHLLLDGRDVGEVSALTYVEPLEEATARWRSEGFDVRVASGGGRMVTTMDRYEADWSVVERGWRAHVLGEGRTFARASEAVTTLRSEGGRVIDQYLPPFVIADAGDPVGTIEDGDAVLFFNFRGDRAVEITRAFEAPAGDFPPFDRVRVPAVRFAGMMQYDGDLMLPSRHLVAPPAIERTMGEYLARGGYRQVAVSETQKYGHVTYFFNGNRSGKFAEGQERYVEVPSDVGDFALRPRMKAAEITDATLREIDDFAPDFVRVNYANGDMVGHTGDLDAAVEAMTCVDREVSRLVSGVLKRGGICVVTADHGNCEQMVARDKETGAPLTGVSPRGYAAFTSHTLNPVPCAVLGGQAGARFVWDRGVAAPGLANLAATCLALMGLEAPEDYLPSLVRAARDDG